MQNFVKIGLSVWVLARSYTPLTHEHFFDIPKYEDIACSLAHPFIVKGSWCHLDWNQGLMFPYNFAYYLCQKRGVVWSTHWQWRIFLHSMTCWRRRRYSAHVVRRRFRGHWPRCLTCLCSHRPPSCSCASGASSPAWAFMFLSCSLKVSLCHFTNAVSCMSEKMSKVLQHFIPKRYMAYQTLCADTYDVLWLMESPPKVSTKCTPTARLKAWYTSLYFISFDKNVFRKCHNGF